ncbi:MAG: hypothetical protein ACFHXK_01555 [bacterium]
MMISVMQHALAESSFVIQITWLAAALVTLGLIVGIDRLIAFVRKGTERDEPDERDKLIELRSSSVAYYVLIVGMIVVGCVMPFSTGGWDIVHAALFAILIAEIVHNGLIVLGYRIGWHA